VSTEGVVEAVEPDATTATVEERSGAESASVSGEPEGTSSDNGADRPAEGAPDAASADTLPQDASTPDGTDASSGSDAGENAEHGEPTPAGEDPVPGTSVRRAEFQALTRREGGSKTDNMYLLLDVTVPVTIELGSAEMYLRDILDLGPGSVVRLDRSVGEPVDVLVNGERVGQGEVVVVDDQFGVRITELLSPEARNPA
jgi:flagellar motor switch protein FliN/FliY